tara:strand:+ start:3492 stop:3668 length:177 start_codon:yes stop_codon:yes gene_type:complete
MINATRTGCDFGVLDASSASFSEPQADSTAVKINPNIKFWLYLIRGILGSHLGFLSFA